MTAAMPGRSTPGSVRNLIVVAATAAPVWPALTIASASPFFTRSTARLTDESFFRRTGFDRAVAHLHDLGGVDDFDPAVVAAVLLQFGFDLRRVADEKEFVDVRILAQRHDRAADKIRRTKIATHGIQRDFHRVGNLRISACECKTKM